MAQLALPPPRPLLHPLRTADTARTTVQDLPLYRRRITIDHRPLAGITPTMLLWWFGHIGGTMTYGGESMPRYLAWHPLDHIHWELARPAPTGGAAEGARFRIVEAFGRQRAGYVDTTETVEKLDETGIRLVRRAFGRPVLQLEHTWSACDHGAHYVSVMEIGARSRPLAPLNRHLTRRRFPERMAHAWIVHNIEEVGYLEHLLPDLYREHAQPGR